MLLYPSLQYPHVQRSRKNLPFSFYSLTFLMVAVMMFSSDVIWCFRKSVNDLSISTPPGTPLFIYLRFFNLFTSRTYLHFSSSYSAENEEGALHPFLHLFNFLFFHEFLTVKFSEYTSKYSPQLVIPSPSPPYLVMFLSFGLFFSSFFFPFFIYFFASREYSSPLDEWVFTHSSYSPLMYVHEETQIIV